MRANIKFLEEEKVVSIKEHKYTNKQELTFAIDLYVWIDEKILKFTKGPQLVQQQLR